MHANEIVSRLIEPCVASLHAKPGRQWIERICNRDYVARNPAATIACQQPS